MANRNVDEVKNERRIAKYISRKLTIFFILVLLAFIILVSRLYTISHDDSDKYKRTVLSQQKYDSTTIPFKRGSILDRNGTTLAFSAQVYNVILDARALQKDADGEKVEPTLIALHNAFGLDPSEIRAYMTANPDSPYKILKKQLSYEEVQAYYALRDAEDSMISKTGIWFENEYKREYPYGSLAADVIGFTSRDNIGQFGLEEYYNDVLSGMNGREYGYLIDDNSLERTTIPAQNGYTLVSTIDAYIQGICEENIIKYNEDHANEYREGEKGSDNTGVIIMDVNTGEVLAMASYPGYDLNNPYDLSAFYTEEEVKQMQDEDTYYQTLNSLWKNFCISQSYEPGSVCKTFTVAAGLDAGSFHDGDTYFCGGYMKFGEGPHAATIRCHNRFGEGELTVKQAVEMSCNVCLMQMGQQMGMKTFLKYFRNFNFGLKTNIDLSGEMRTASLVFTEDTMGPTELATSTFGQGFNVTMIQTISAFCSIINGGYYYQPHMVSKIVDDTGATVENIEPVLLRQTVSEEVSAHMRDYCIGVVEEGTGTYSRPAGYMIGGKTGTAEHSGEGKKNYVVSFMGFAPADDPKIAIYVVIDRPNVAEQDSATRYACVLCRSILTDVLPYLNIYMTEELSEKEQAEMEEHGSHVFTVSGNGVSENSISGNSASGNNISDNSISENEISDTEEVKRPNVIIDPNTGYAIDPINGEFLDPVTGVPINGESSIYQDGDGESIGFTEREEPIEETE